MIQGTTVLKKINQSNKRIVVLRGGSGAGKTYSMCQLMAIWLMSGRYSETEKLEQGVWSVVRKHSTDLDKSVLRDFISILQKEGWYLLVNHNKSLKTFQYKGRIVEFLGADDEQKLRGARRDFLYCNEGNELNYHEEFHQLNIRTRVKVFIDFNPDDEDAWMNVEIEQKRAMQTKDVEVIKATYNDNPFLSKQERFEIENLQNIDPMLWKIYGLGEYGRMEGLVYKINIVQDIPKDARLLGYGLDFGFTNHPSVLVEVLEYDNEYYIRELFYETGLMNDAIAERLKGLNKEVLIIADSAEPKSIEEIKVKGVDNILGAVKGMDSIIHGINIVKQKKINVTQDSTDLIKEFNHYKWAVDKHGKALNVPVKAFDHGMDAIRYCISYNVGGGDIEPVIKFI